MFAVGKKKKKSVCRYQILCDPRFKAYLPRERLPIGRSSSRQHRKHAEAWDDGARTSTCHHSSDLLRASQERTATLHAQARDPLAHCSGDAVL